MYYIKFKDLVIIEKKTLCTCLFVVGSFLLEIEALKFRCWLFKLQKFNSFFTLELQGVLVWAFNESIVLQKKKVNISRELVNSPCTKFSSWEKKIQIPNARELSMCFSNDGFVFITMASLSWILIIVLSVWRFCERANKISEFV